MLVRLIPAFCQKAVIGDDVESVIYSFLTRMPHHLSVGKGKAIFSAVLVEVDESTGRANNIQRVQREEA
jgi:calcineurin-like phosphoesterase